MVKKNGRKKGFTLIELVVVIAILAILLAIATPAYTGYRDRAETQAIETNKRMLENAAILYISDTGTTDFTWSDGSGDAGKYVSKWPDGYTLTSTVGKVEVKYEKTKSP